MLEIKVREIRGRCPVYHVGDRIVIDDPKILLDRTDEKARLINEDRDNIGDPA
jgi:uncharacterized repeat protein (TIGR04076 family)